MNINEIMLFVWGGVFAICLLLEIFTSDLVSVWFCGGSLVSIILVSIGWALEFEPMWWISIIVFVFVSCLLLLLLRPITKKYLFKREIKSNVDELIGKKAYVIKDISELQRGEIKVNDVIWTAEASDPKEKINKNDIVVILAIEGNKAIVSKVDIK